MNFGNWLDTDFLRTIPPVLMNWELKRPPFHGVEHGWLWFRLWGNLIFWKTTTTCIRAWECTVKYSGPDEPKQKFRVCTISEVIFSLSQPAQFSDFQAFFGEGVWRVYLCQLCSDDLDDATSSTFFFFFGWEYVFAALTTYYSWWLNPTRWLWCSSQLLGKSVFWR